MRARKLTAAVAAVPLLLAGAIGTAYADDISNSLDTTIDATAETMALTAGGTNGTTTLSVETQNGDGKNGCNLTGSTTLTIALQSSNTSVATVSPSSVTFSSCGDTPTLTVTPVGPGTATVSASQTSNTTTGTFDLTPATFTVNVAPAPVTDQTAPVISYALTPSTADGDNGWYHSAVTLDWTVTENESPSSLSTNACDDQSITQDQAATTYTCSASSAGGSAERSVTIKRDSTAPVVAYDSVVGGTEGTNGWYTSDVTAQFTGTDALSGPASATQTVTSVGEGVAVEVLSPEFTDDAGNTAPAGAVTQTFKIDKTAPTGATFSSTFADGSYYSNTVPAAPTCEAIDALSGHGACVVEGYSTEIGTHTLVAVATDLAGNTARITGPTYRVTYRVEGFFAPVDRGIHNTVKGGATVPLKFRVYDGSVEQTGLSVVTKFAVSGGTCNTALAQDVVEETSTANTGLKYDTLGGHFLQSWKTPKATGCYVATVTLKDGSSISASFLLK